MALSKEEVFNRRKEFFEDAMQALKVPPQPIDRALDQHQYYVAPSEAHSILDEKLGDFLVLIDPVFYGQRWPLSYSMWQIGESLKIAIILEGPGEIAPAWDPNEFNDMWGGMPPQLMNRNNKSFYEWSFDVPGFHENYALRERFILGLRHMHFRALKVLKVMADRRRVAKEKESEFEDE